MLRVHILIRCGTLYNNSCIFTVDQIICLYGIKYKIHLYCYDIKAIILVKYSICNTVILLRYQGKITQIFSMQCGYGTILLMTLHIWSFQIFNIKCNYKWCFGIEGLRWVGIFSTFNMQCIYVAMILMIFQELLFQIFRIYIFNF